MIRNVALDAKKFWQLSPPNQWLLLQALIGLIITIVCIRLLPFHWIVPWIGKQNQESDFTMTSQQLIEIKRARWALLRLSRSFPWLSTCLTRAMTAKLILSQKNIHSTLYLGASLNTQKALEAHAWLRYGNINVVGGGNQHKFSTLVSYT